MDSIFGLLTFLVLRTITIIEMTTMKRMLHTITKCLLLFTIESTGPNTINILPCVNITSTIWFPISFITRKRCTMHSFVAFFSIIEMPHLKLITSFCISLCLCFFFAFISGSCYFRSITLSISMASVRALARSCTLDFMKNSVQSLSLQKPQCTAAKCKNCSQSCALL